MKSGRAKTRLMPQLSRFYGIIIYLYFKDHNPPHFHAWYSEHKCEISITDLNIIGGSLPSRALSLVTELAGLHQEELIGPMESRKEGQPFTSIEPLP